jgi:cytochrome c
MSPIRTASIAAVTLVASLLLACVHPFGDAGLFAQNAAQPPLLEHSSISSDVRALLIAKCADCHSSQTRAPIYGHFAPISWLLERDIVEARKHMNLSQWGAYSADQQQTFAARIVQQAKSGHMPPMQYRVIHWNAGITPADERALTQWAHNPTTAAAESASPETAKGDPVRGKAVFEKRCTGCHALTENREGPSLEGVYGRPAAAVPGFSYSDALRKANITWNDQTLEQWLTDPDAFLPGNNMDFLVARPQERKDLIAYFKNSAGK